MDKQKLSFGKWYDSLILFLCIYVLVELAIEVITIIPNHILSILNYIDLAICIIFLFDWFFFLIKAENKKLYIKQRFLDLIGSIPYVQFMRPFRLLRAVRLTRALKLLRGLRSSKSIFRFFVKNTARSALTIYLSITSIIYFYCCLGLYTFEKSANDMIHTFGDVLWMGFTTLTSVGYGDIYPVTTQGRILSVFLVTTGMGLFGLVTAEIASIFINKIKKHQ